MEHPITPQQKVIKLEHIESMQKLKDQNSNEQEFDHSQKNFQNSNLLQRNIQIDEEKRKNQQFKYQMKNIGLDCSSNNMNKTQFVHSISKALGNFFNPMITALANKQKSLCLKLGLPVQDEEKNTKNKARQEMQEEAKIQSINQSNNKNSTKIKITNKNQQIQQTKGNKSLDKQNEDQNYLKGARLNKRRIIRKIVRKPAFVRRDQQQKVLVKQMQQNFDCKLKNNRLYIKGMPKKPVSSFFFFFKQYSKKIHQQNEQLQISKQLTYGSALAKRISKRWKEMTNQQKIPYKQLSQTTRQAYQKTMQQFKNQNKEVFDSFKKIKRIKANETRRIKIQRQTHDNQFQQIQVEEGQNEEKIENELQSSGKKSVPLDLQNEEQLPIMIPEEEDDQKTKKRRPPQRNMKQKFKSIHKPKSPSPSFFFYYNQKKAQISKEHNVTRGAKITQIASEMWKKMSQQQKNPYERKANERRIQYYEEMKKFQVDYPQDWAKMIANRRRVTGNQFLKKNSENRLRQLSKASDIEEQNSESIEEKSQQIDSLQGVIIQKPKTTDIIQNIEQKIHSESILQQKNNNQQNSQLQKPKVQKSQGRKRPPIQNRAQKSQKSCQNQPKKDEKDESNKKSNRPKAPISSFFMFYRQNNSLLAQQFQQKNGGKLVQYASQIWKNMNETEKKPYEIQAIQSRQKYYKEMEIYKQKFPEQVKQRRIDLKKKHQNLSNQNSGQKGKRNQKKVEPFADVKKQTVDSSNKIKSEEDQ